METRHRSPLRILAPVAIVVFGIAFLLVIASGGGGDDGGGGERDNAAEQSRDLGTPARNTSKKREKSTKSDDSQSSQSVYVVKQGDTLGGISEKTGVPVERLQELNPGLDQFSLVSGQKIKLR